MARLRVRLTPRGGRDRIEGWIDDPSGRLLKVRVAAPPIDGQANAALIRVFAKTVGVPKSAVRLVAGQTSRIKTLEVDATLAEISRHLGGPA